MTQQDRGAYAPPTADAPLAFDARQPVRGARPMPITLILSLMVLVGLVAAIIVFYRLGARAAGDAPQAVGTPVGAIKAPPPADAQPQDPAAGLQIYQAESPHPAQAAAAQPKFVPPPEQPALRPGPAAAPPPPPPAQVVAAKPAPVQPAPVKPAAIKPVPAASRPTHAVAAPAPAPAPKVAAPPAKAAAPAAKAAGGAAVQIGAVSSTALADRAWSEAVAVAPGQAAGKGKGVERIEKDGHVLFRTAVTGFESRADAAAFCAKLKAAGKACFVK